MIKLLKVGLILFIVTLIGCGDDDKGTGPAADPWIGTWKGTVTETMDMGAGPMTLTVNIEMTLNADLTYASEVTGTMGPSAFENTEAGTYTITDTSLTTTSVTCTDEGVAADCDEPLTETVAIVLSGKTMTVTLDQGPITLTKQ